MNISIRDRSVHPSLDRAFEIALNLGFSGVELSIGGPKMREHLIWRRGGLMKMADFLQEAPVGISSAHLGSYQAFGLDKPLGEKLFQALLPRAAKLRISVLTVSLSPAALRDSKAAAQTLAKRCKEGAQRGFDIAVGLPLDINDAQRFLDAVGADNLGTGLRPAPRRAARAQARKRDTQAERTHTPNPSARRRRRRFLMPHRDGRRSF